jgi:hypothetical protein
MSGDDSRRDGTHDWARCECVVWRDGDRRCELWMVNGIGHLRLFDGEVLLVDEPALSGALWAQTLALRTWRPGRRRHRYEFGVRDSY